MPVVVNGEVVDEDILSQEFASIKAQFESMGKISCCERDDEFRGYARDNIVSRMLLNQEAARAMPEPSLDEIDAAIKQLKEDHGGEEQFFTNTGLTPDQQDVIRENVGLNLRVDHLLRNVCGPDPTPTEAEIDQYYQDHKDQFLTQTEVRALHILKTVRKVEDREKMFEELCQLREAAVNGADFEELARKNSDIPPEEADLGFFKRGELLDEFELVAFSMRPGEISPVFGTQFGLHLAKITDRKSAQAKPLAEVRDEVIRLILEEARNTKIKAYIDSLKAKAQIDEIEEESEEPA